MATVRLSTLMAQVRARLVVDITANLSFSSVNIDGGTIDGTAIGGAVPAAGAFTSLTVGDAAISEAELEMLDGITAGTVAASKAVVVDANKDIASFRNITLTGELDAGSLDVSGDVDVDGTLETDALSIASTLVTSTAAELNILDGVTSTTAELNILDGVTSTAAELNILDGVTSTAAELNILDGVTSTAAELNYNDTGAAVGTVVASKTVTVDANKDAASFRNITLTGELDAGSLDVSGDADIDGTLETDALSINGTVVSSTAAELNILDGVTSTTAELNILDGVTSTAAELNILDGVTSTAAELNILDGVTSTAAELNILMVLLLPPQSLTT
jgi:cytoskeletal protein CcmA (bactofilin family)